ncbi:MAG: DUF952 domain-containing protein [Spirochaetales bacterium]|nr:DUF952 domain-containing protein [Spirochaetales bacterium]
MNIQTEIIYHIVSSANFKNDVVGSMYAPGSLLRTGFIHCTSGEETTLLAAEDFFSNIKGIIYLLKIVVNAVIAPVRFEDAAPSPESGKNQLEAGSLFPHIYGSLNMDAIEGIGTLTRYGTGFLWPDNFFPDFTKFI